MAQPQTNNNAIKILSLVWFKVLPAKYGGQKAVALFNRHLAVHATLLCLCSKNNEAVDTGYRIDNSLPVGKAQFFNPFIWLKIYRTVKKESVTHLLLEFPYHGIAGVLCKKLLGVKLVVHEHNIEYLRFKEQKERGWWWLYLLERWTLRHADAVFFITKEDRQTAEKSFGLKPEKLSVVSYGVTKRNTPSREEAQAVIKKRHSIQPKEKILLFAGTLDYNPNADAIVAIYEYLIPLLDQQNFHYKIITCGRNQSSFHYLNELKAPTKLVMAGEVDDVETYFLAADVFINPVLTGGGVQTKTLDALSYHLNVVCFDSKLRGIENAGEKVFAVADGDWQAFANVTIAATQSSAPTPAAFFETYDWRTIAAKAYQKMLAC